MADWEDRQELANDYVAGRVKLAKLANWLNDRIEQWIEMPGERPERQLRSFIQVRIYDMDHGLPEDELRRELTDYLSEQALLRPAASHRATG